MFGSLTSGALGRKFEMLSEGYPMAPWEISQLDRHMLSYCVSLENTPTQERACIVRGKKMEVDKRKKYVRWLSNQNAVSF